MTRRNNLALAAAGLALVIGSAAHAQSVMTPGSVPPPPSFRDSEKQAAQAEARRAKKPTRAQADSAADPASAPRRTRRSNAAEAPSEGVSSRIDTRPARADARRMELEDDPRTVAPIMNNGRPGVGMRF